LDYFEHESRLNPEFEEPECFLGDWLANLVWYGPTSMALCVNEKTRYAIVIPLAGCDSVHILYILLAQRAYDAVRRVGATAEIARRVLDEYRGGVRIAPTNNRSVVGTMNDLANHMVWHLDQVLETGPVRDPADLDDVLNEVPHRPLRWSNARDELIEACRAASA
jgi:hypothetical protein